jgi:tRNA1Val (adenine37-N6)-methyltransferase
MKAAFRFKQFCISDHNCAMKLSTDAVLLGAMPNFGLSSTILDIGTGCGILALMAAQKSTALIDAVEIEEHAARQANQNFQESKWRDRIKIHHTSIREFSEKCNIKYETIICNPPYFQGQLKSPDEHRNNAKHNSILDFEELSQCVGKLLSENGIFWVIIPVSEKNNFLRIFLKSGLYCTQNIFIADKPGTEPHRVVFCFSRQAIGNIESQSLILKNQDGTPSESYIQLTKDFYLDF